MTSILDPLTASLIEDICDDLPAIDAARRKTSGNAPHDGFLDYFKSFKLSFCQVSLDILKKIATHKDISQQVEHITLGTETLDQYRHEVALDQSSNAASHREQYERLLHEEEEARLNVSDLLIACCEKLPNLRSVKIEDRPSGLDSLDDYTPSFGSAKIKQLTGIELSVNGPFPNTAVSLILHGGFPVRSRGFAYASAAIFLRQLDITGRQLALDLVVGGYTDAEGRSCFAAPFDPSTALFQRMVERNLRYLEIRDVDTNLRSLHEASNMVEFVPQFLEELGPDHGLDTEALTLEMNRALNKPILELRAFLRGLKFHRIVFNRCVFRAGQIKDVLAGFGALRLVHCVDAQDLAEVMAENRLTLASLDLDHVLIFAWNYEEDFWTEFVESLRADSAITHIRLNHVCAVNEEFTMLELSAEWNGQEAVVSRAEDVLHRSRASLGLEAGSGAGELPLGEPEDTLQGQQGVAT